MHSPRVKISETVGMGDGAGGDGDLGDALHELGGDLVGDPADHRFEVGEAHGYVTSSRANARDLLGRYRSPGEKVPRVRSG